jgi:hypothetical protein
MRQFAYNVCSFVFQVLTFAAVVVGVVAIWLQVRALNQQFRVQQAAVHQMTLPTIIQLLESPDVRAARRTVRTNLGGKAVSEWTADEQAAAADVLAAFDLAAALARRDQIDVALLVDHWGHEIATVGRTCRDYITGRRSKEGRGYLANFHWLAAEADRQLAEQDLAK